MKTNRIILVFVFCLVAVIGAMLTKQRAPHSKELSNVSTGFASNSVLPITNHIQVTEANGKTSATSDNDYFKKIVDPETGEYVVANADKTMVFLKDKVGNVIWSADLAECFKGTQLRDMPFDRHITYMDITNKWGRTSSDNTNELVVFFGKFQMGIDKKTGKLKSYGCD